MLLEARNVRFPGAEVTGLYEPPNVGARTQEL